MLVTKLRIVEGSVVFAIPKAILEELHLRPNALVGMSMAEGKLIVDPQPMPRRTLAGLLAECDPAAPRPTDDRAWLVDGPAGQKGI